MRISAKISAQRFAISTALGAGLLVIGLIVGAGITYATVGTSSGATTTTTITGAGGSTVTTTMTGSSGPVTYTIGSIQPLTGTYASFGLSFQNSVDLAVAQMNANLTAAGSNIQFKTVHADDAGVPAQALSALQSEYQSSGVQAVIGPLTSGEVLATVQYATQNHIIILPGAATATSLIGISQYIYRPGQPGDQFEGTTIAQSVIQTGGKNVVYLYRDDTSEYGTYNISSKIMLAAGLKVDGIALPPNAADYAAQVQTADTDVGTFGTTGTVVVLGDGGTEAQNVFQHASTSTNLPNVRWYGIESLNDPSLLGSAVGAFMAATHLTISSPQVLNSPQFEYFNATYTAKYGTPPTPYSNYFYDNAWIAMLSILAAGSNDGAKIIQVLPLVADHFFGSSSTGIWLVNHDQSIAYYDVLECGMVGSTPTFTKIGTYNGGTNQLTLS